MEVFGVAVGGLTAIETLIKVFKCCSELIEYLKSEHEIWLEVYNELTHFGTFLEDASRVYKQLHERGRLPQNEDEEWSKLVHRVHILGEKLREIYTKWEATKSKKEWRIEIARKSALFYFSKRSPIDKLLFNLQNVKMTILLRQQLLTNHLYSEFDNGHIIHQLNAMDEKLSRLESARFEDENSAYNSQHIALTRTGSTEQQYGFQEEERLCLSDSLSVDLEQQAEKGLKKKKRLKLHRIFRKGKQPLTSQSDKSFSGILSSIVSHDGILDSNTSEGNRVSFTVTQQELKGILDLAQPSSTTPHPPSPKEDSTAHFHKEHPVAQVTSLQEKSEEIKDTLDLPAIAKEVSVSAESHDLDIARNEHKRENSIQDMEQTAADCHGFTRYMPPSVEAVQELDSSPENSIDNAPWLLEPTETLRSTHSPLTVESRDEILINETPRTLSSLQDSPKRPTCQNDNSTTPHQRQQYTNENDFNSETPPPESLQPPSGRRRLHYGCSCRYGSCQLHSHYEDNTYGSEGFMDLQWGCESYDTPQVNPVSQYLHQRKASLLFNSSKIR